MTGIETRTVGERGQVTLPKRLREAFGIRGGDEVVVHEEDGRIIIEKTLSREEFAKGYRQRAERNESLATELEGISREANELLGDPPEWEDEDARSSR